MFANRLIQPVVLFGLLVLLYGGCGKKSDQDTSALKKAFSKSPPAGQDPLLKGAVEQAIGAVADGDLGKAIESLAIVRVQPNLSEEQQEAVQSAMSSVQTQLATRADAGDAAAKEALDRYRALKRR